MAKKILVIVNDTPIGDELQDAVRGPGDATRVLVVAPAVSSPLRLWTSDTGAAERAARARLESCVARLDARGLQAEGMIGDADPVHAAIDALHVFPADEVVISSHADQRSTWLATRLVERIAEHYDGPILHVVVDAQRALQAA